MVINVEVTQDRQGCLGSVDQATYVAFLRTLIDLDKNLYKLKDVIKTQKEIENSRNPVGFQDNLLDALDDFYNNVDKAEIQKCYQLITRLVIAEPEIGTLGIMQALEMLCIPGKISNIDDVRFLELIQPHVDDWEEFNPLELTMLHHLYEIILSSINHYILDNFFRNMRISDYDDNTTNLILDKSVNTYLATTLQKPEQILTELGNIYEDFTPQTDVLTKDPNKALALVRMVDDAELLERILENKELLTEEDLDLILSGKLEANQDFLIMLETRSEVDM